MYLALFVLFIMLATSLALKVRGKTRNQVKSRNAAEALEGTKAKVGRAVGKTPWCKSTNPDDLHSIHFVKRKICPGKGNIRYCKMIRGNGYITRGYECDSD